MDIEKKAVQLSNLLYNRGLDKAQIRDLSGAVELLRQSLQYNKNNINARNLLGLVYFEMGEAVAALSEWVISKNLQPQDNIAAQYIDRLQSNQAKLSVINQTIRDYNIALENCRRGDEDIAAITSALSNPEALKEMVSGLFAKDGIGASILDMLGGKGGALGKVLDSLKGSDGGYDVDKLAKSLEGAEEKDGSVVINGTEIPEEELSQAVTDVLGTLGLDGSAESEAA